MPDCSDSAASDASEFCVGTQHSARSAEILTVQFIGSIVACARNGVLYTASTRLAALWMAARASPSLRNAYASFTVNPSARCSAIEALDWDAPAPSSQAIGNASSAVVARHHVSATTATVESLTFTTPRTPGRPSIFAWSKLTSLPPNTGQALTAACNIPGRRRSIAYTFLPSSLEAVSSRFIGLPAIFQSFGSLSVMVFGSGGVSLEAAEATLPYVVRRRDGACVITPSATLSSVTGTLH